MFVEVSFCNRKKEKYHTDKVHQVARVNHTPTNTVIMKIDPKHFNVVIRTCSEQRNFTDCIESTKYQETKKRSAFLATERFYLWSN